MLDILNAGLAPALVPYRQGWDLQRRIHAGVVDGTRRDTLILLEHEAVYTAGTRTLPEECPQDGTPVIDVDRGGKITWHGPGQLVGYPIVRLPEPVDVVAHVRRLERLLIGVLAGVGIAGHQVAGRSGVWVDGPRTEDKIAAIGIRVQNGVTMHGFALNCDNTLDGFAGIVPCGIRDAGVATATGVAGRRITTAEMLPLVVDAFTADRTEVAA